MMYISCIRPIANACAHHEIYVVLHHRSHVYTSAGPKQCFQSAMVGGLLLMVIEGMSVSLQRMMAPAEPWAVDANAAAVREAVVQGQRKVIGSGADSDSLTSIGSQLNNGSRTHRPHNGQYSLFNSIGTSSVALNANEYIFSKADDESLM